jgi:acid phosphatase type 7
MRQTSSAAALFVLFVLLGAIVPAGLRATELVRGPYLQWVEDDGITIVWDQDAPSAPLVRYGPTSALEHSAPTSGPATHHEVRLLGLAPGTTYYYRLYDGEEPLSEVLSFPTAVAPGEPFRFLLYGDTRNQTEVHRAVVHAMAEEPDVRFYVHTGDFVADGQVQAQWDTFFEVERPLASRLPLYGVIGNHDVQAGEARLFRQHLVLPDDSPRPEQYYSFDYGNAHFVVLDGHVNIDPWFLCALRGLASEDCFDERQVAWLEADLRAAAEDAAIDHVFVLVHIGPYTSKERRRGNAHMRELLGLFEETGVTAVLSGHDHYYERGFSPNGIPYLISGGGGAPLYEGGAPVPPPHRRDVNVSAHHYVVVDVDGPRVTFTARSPEGVVLDVLELGPPAHCEAGDDCPRADGPPVTCDVSEGPCLDVSCMLACVEAGAFGRR